MAENHQPTCRGTAVAIVSAAAAGNGYADEMLERVRAEGRLEPRDLALARQIVLGTLRWRLTLDHLIAVFASRPLRRIQSHPLNVLRTALYQILFLDRVPASAATHEAVTLAGPRAGGFVNAVLRSCVRARVEERSEDPTRSLDFTGIPRSFSRPVFPHPADDRLAHWVARYSHPAVLIQMLWNQYGEDDARRIMIAGNRPPAVTVRANTLAGTADQLAHILDAASIGYERLDGGNLFRLNSATGLFNLPAYFEGRFYIQDVSAAQIAPLLDPQPGEQILDACSAPGGKASHLAQLTGDRATIVACDVSKERIVLLESNLARLRLRSVTTRCVDLMALPEEFRGRFDKLLIDMPCSNTGVLARRPEARYRVTADQVTGLVQQQRALLASVANALKPGGLLVYSTCSVLQEENEAVVRHFCEERTTFQIKQEKVLLPGEKGGDGAYAAVLKRCE